LFGLRGLRLLESVLVVVMKKTSGRCRSMNILERIVMRKKSVVELRHIRWTILCCILEEDPYLKTVLKLYLAG
jgi:hypothetical protein